MRGWFSPTYPVILHKSGGEYATQETLDRLDGKPGRVQRPAECGGSALEHLEGVAKRMGIETNVAEYNERLADWVNRQAQEAVAGDHSKG